MDLACGRVLAAAPGDRRFRSIGDLECGLTVAAAPVDPADARRALARRVGAYTAVHRRLPAKGAVADLWLLRAPPRSELSSAALARLRLHRDRDGSDASPWRG